MRHDGRQRENRLDHGRPGRRDDHQGAGFAGSRPGARGAHLFRCRRGTRRRRDGGVLGAGRHREHRSDRAALRSRRIAGLLQRALRRDPRPEVRGARRRRGSKPGRRPVACDRHLLRGSLPGSRADRRARRARGPRPAHRRGRADPEKRRLLRWHAVRASDRAAAAPRQRRRAGDDGCLQRAHANHAVALQAERHGRGGRGLARAGRLPGEGHERLPDQGRRRRRRLRRRDPRDEAPDRCPSPPGWEGSHA